MSSRQYRLNFNPGNNVEVSMFLITILKKETHGREINRGYIFNVSLLPSKLS